MSERDPDPADGLHAWFDRELTPERAAELEARWQADPDLRRRRDALKAMETWLRDTSPAAPETLGVRIDRAIAEENAGRERDSRVSRRGRAWIRWAWLPAAAAAAVAILLLRQGPTVPSRAADGTVGRDFMVAAEGARQVCLVGDFNQWKVCNTPLTPAGNGLWKIHLDLPHGRHEYLFVIDGRWETDPSVPQTVDDGFGSKNTLLLL